jgi:hypothetical protein
MQSCFLDEFSNKLLIVDPIGMREYSITFASRYIEDEVISNYKKRIPKEMLAFIRVSQSKSTISAIRGIIFERFAHAVLSQGGEFDARNLSLKKTKKIHLQKRKYSWYRVIDGKIAYEESDSKPETNLYSRPRSRTEGAFDSFDDLHFFQMTVSPNKRVELSFIEQNLLNRGLLIEEHDRFTLKRKPVNIIFVVPEDIFPSFEKNQPFESESVKSWADDIEQYAISIPINSEFLQKLESLEDFFDQI